MVVGTEVSARYKGAFCEAKIKSVERRLKFKIQLTEDNTQHTFEEEDILGVTSINTITVGSKVTCRNPNSSSSESTVRGTIVKVFDQSKYLVAFDDGDQALLKRSLMYNKSGKFAFERVLLSLYLTICCFSQENTLRQVRHWMDYHSPIQNRLANLLWIPFKQEGDRRAGEADLLIKAYPLLPRHQRVGRRKLQLWRAKHDPKPMT